MICVFGVCNQNYISKVLVALLTAKTHNPNYDYYILTSKYNKEERRLCNDLGVKLILTELSSDFRKQWEYPRECFYHFKGPEIFHKLGYKYSIYIDGDIYCNSKINLDYNLIKDIGGGELKRIKKFYYSIYGNIGKKKKLFDKYEDRDRVNTGVLIYNNESLTKKKFYKKIRLLYNKLLNYGIPCKGDDSLLAVFLLQNPKIDVVGLGRNYNYITTRWGLPKLRKNYYTSQESVINNVIFYHCVIWKPWNIKKKNKFPNYTTKYFCNKWIDTMIDNFSQKNILKYFPEFYKEITPYLHKYNFYWYSGKKYKFNFGDDLLPYMLSKVTKNKIICTKPKDTNKKVLMGPGSIIPICEKNTIVWGSGIKDVKRDVKKCKLLGVRGPLTRNKFIKKKCECPPLYGDPGLLMSLFYNPNIEKTYKIGIIPHVTQYNKVKKLYENDDNCIVIDLTYPNIEKIVDKIKSCENIVSSSLHGIITAHAYNIPVRWITYADSLFGDGTKFYDHYLSVNVKNPECIDATTYKHISVKELLKEFDEIKEVPEYDLDKIKNNSVFRFINNKILFKKSVKYMLS